MITENYLNLLVNGKKLLPHRQEPIDSDYLNRWVAEVSDGKHAISEEEEHRLFKEYMEGDNRSYAQAELLAYNTRPLLSIALDVYHHFPHGKECSLMDLLSLAVQRFLELLPSYQPDRARMITFYTREVKTRLQRFVIKHGTTVARGSVYSQGIASKLAKKANQMRHKEHADYGVSAVAKEAGVNEKSAMKALTASNLLVYHVPHLEDALPPDPIPNPIDNIHGLLRNRLNILSDEQYEETIRQLASGESPPEDVINKLRETHDTWT